MGPGTRKPSTRHRSHCYVEPGRLWGHLGRPRCVQGVAALEARQGPRVPRRCGGELGAGQLGRQAGREPESTDRPAALRSARRATADLVELSERPHAGRMVHRGGAGRLPRRDGRLPDLRRGHRAQPGASARPPPDGHPRRCGNRPLGWRRGPGCPPPTTSPVGSADHRHEQAVGAGRPAGRCRARSRARSGAQNGNDTGASVVVQVWTFPRSPSPGTIAAPSPATLTSTSSPDCGPARRGR